MHVLGKFEIVKWIGDASDACFVQNKTVSREGRNMRGQQAGTHGIQLFRQIDTHNSGTYSVTHHQQIL